ncbi:MAG: hypothetical protein EA425_11280 [Puniceicoccaceae bacterium]|nr:MAG: hypothetical protein EA425_11280 [Puniceicoccaceae bacterium]
MDLHLLFFRFPLHRTAVLAGALLLAAAPLSARAAADFIWIEAQSPVEPVLDAVSLGHHGHPELLSGGAWLSAGITEEEAADAVPPEGLRLRYRVTVEDAATFQAWARIGYEGARSPFEWRINGGEWRRVEPDQATTNVMRLGEWVEVAWLHLGEVTLPAGSVDWEFRYPRPAEGRFLMGLDTLALVVGDWVPEGRLRPDESYDDAPSEAAREKVYQLPDADGASRSSVELSGLWEFARYDDPDMNENTYEPIASLPREEDYPLRWMGVEVPGSSWNHRPETAFAHRAFYRTRIDVPATHADRGFKLNSWGTNWIVSVFVNGELAGTHRSVWIPWQMDLSDHIRPGEVNELVIGVKGSYYAVDPRFSSPQEFRNRPVTAPRGARWIAPIYPSTKGDGNGLHYGLVNQLFLESVGKAYVEEVVTRPSVENRRLEADLTLHNTSPTARTVTVQSDAVYEADGRVERSFDPVTVDLPPNGSTTVTIAGDWDEPRLWWPQTSPEGRADLYDLRTTITEAGRPLDVHLQRFGFREVTVRGTGIYINGVRRNFWSWVSVRGNPRTEEEWLEAFHAEDDGSRFRRFSAGRRTSAFLHSRRDRLDFYDRHGIPGRLCSMIDGMFVSYLMPTDNRLLWENMREHIDQMTRAWRNHPSVIIYQVENEFLYINGWNLYRHAHWSDMVAEWIDILRQGKANDPTRPMESGGAGDLQVEAVLGGMEEGGFLSTNSPHYPEAAYDYYPDNAYALEHYSTKAAHWPWRRDKPYIVGESLFARHLELATLTLGDRAYTGMDAQRAGKARYLRMMYGGYRWAGVSAWYPWDHLGEQEDAQKVMSALAAIPRKQTHRLHAGQENRLQFKIMNDTLSADPVMLEWNYRADGRILAGESVELDIERGYGREFEIVINAPEVAERTEGSLFIRLSQPLGKSYRDSRDIPILPAVTSLRVEVPLFVYESEAAVSGFLAARDVAFTRLESLGDPRLTGGEGLLIVGPDALSADESTGNSLRTFAERGGRVIVLEQDNPVAGDNLPVEIITTERFGGYAHPRALGTPVFQDLGVDDLIDWAGDHPTFKRVYEKPVAGARSLAEAGAELPYAPLIEVPVRNGVIVLCQLRVGAKLEVDAAAAILFRNLVETYADFRPAAGVARLFTPGSGLLAEALAESGLHVRPTADLVAALDPDRTRALIISATHENLDLLISRRSQVEAFQEAGGWIILHGLQPRGMAAFNRLLDTGFLLRPFRRERVTLHDRSSPVSAFLGNQDVALLSHRVIQHGRRWVYDHTFSYVIDAVENVAPFTLPPGAPDDPYAYQPTENDQDPFNFVNGLINADDWRYIRQLWWEDPENEPLDLVFRLRAPESLNRISIWNNANYGTIEDIEVIFDGDETRSVRARLPDAPERTDIDFNNPVEVESTVTLRLLSRRIRGTHENRAHLVGIDNVEFRRARPPESRALDSVGGLVPFPRGEGGVLLNQIKFMPAFDEPTEDHVGSKRRLNNALLQNLGVGAPVPDA